MYACSALAYTYDCMQLALQVVTTRTRAAHARAANTSCHTCACAAGAQLPRAAHPDQVLRASRNMQMVAARCSARCTSCQELASEQTLTPEVRKGLCNPTFRETIVAILARDPAQRSGGGPHAALDRYMHDAAHDKDGARSAARRCTCTKWQALSNVIGFPQ
jgi:hypothetical protein